MAIIASSCNQNEPDDSPYVDPEDPTITGVMHSTILVYAVATNNLGPNLISDKNEMLQAASSIDLERNNVLVYEIRNENVNERPYNTNPYVTLQKLVKTEENGGEYKWQIEKSYDLETASLNPSRISEVIDYVTENYPAETYGLIFWSHSSGATPYITKSTTGNANYNTQDLPMAYSFGEDNVESGDEFFKINVEELAGAIPDNLFNFIWFDSCYMGNIESIYEFKGKCNYYSGYATEVCAAGMPYQYTLPYLVGKNPDLLSAAERFFKYYNEEYYYQLATIALIDMRKIDTLADYCKDILSGSKAMPSPEDMHQYTNKSQVNTISRFYDLGDYVKAVASMQGRAVTKEEWDDVLSQCVIYKDATPYDFSGWAIDPERYSGISTYNYAVGIDTDTELYYESLNWFKTVYL